MQNETSYLFDRTMTTNIITNEEGGGGATASRD